MKMKCTRADSKHFQILEMSLNSFRQRALNDILHSTPLIDVKVAHLSTEDVDLPTRPGLHGKSAA